jgi:chromosomal replication initiator protein
VLSRDPKLNVEYVTLEDFVEQLHAAIASNEADRFKQRYGRVDLLLLDDMQFLTGRRETQTEMLRLLNAMSGTGRQVVMTSDRPPSEIPDVDERLITRLSGGLIVDIGAPDYETRIAILRARCEERGVRFQAGVVEELANLEFRNIRELQGSLNKLIATQTLGGDHIAPDQVKAMFGGDQAPRPTPARLSSPMKTPAGRPSLDFQSFVTDIASAVAAHVDPWKIKVAEAVAFWTGEGYRTGKLERLLLEGGPKADYEGALREFFAAIEKLRQLEGQATAVDPGLGSSDVFRDPERLAEAEALAASALQGSSPPPGPSAAFTRAGFEVGSSNQLATKAADAVIAEPGKKYNPLFIHGPSGVGKTHLVNAIGNEMIQATGGASVVACVSAQAFMDELIAAMQDGSVDRWRTRYRGADALVIDDVQFVAGKERTQDELFHVFNTLHKEGKQLVFASDRPPKALDGLEDRLRSRFEGGLVVEMQAPDRSLREKLYAHYLDAHETPEREALVAYLAGRAAANVREVIGVVNRLVAAADNGGVPLSVAFAKTELEGAAPQGTPDVRATDNYFLDAEKIVWHLPDISARLIEDPK